MILSDSRAGQDPRVIFRRGPFFRIPFPTLAINAVPFYTFCEAVFRLPFSSTFRGASLAFGTNVKGGYLHAAGRWIVVFVAENFSKRGGIRHLCKETIADFARFDIDAEDMCMSCAMDKVKELSLVREERLGDLKAELKEYQEKVLQGNSGVHHAASRYLVRRHQGRGVGLRGHRRGRVHGPGQRAHRLFRRRIRRLP